MLDQIRIFLHGIVVCHPAYMLFQDEKSAAMDECDWLNEAREFGWDWYPSPPSTSRQLEEA